MNESEECEFCDPEYYVLYGICPYCRNKKYPDLFYIDKEWRLNFQKLMSRLDYLLQRKIDK